MLARLNGMETTSLSDGTQRWTGRHAGREIVVASFFGMGNVHSAAETAKLLPEIQPAEVILVGICGGLASDESRFGDVVVAKSITHCEPAKETEGETKYRPQHKNCSQRLLKFSRQAGERFSGLGDSNSLLEGLPRSPPLRWLNSSIISKSQPSTRWRSSASVWGALFSRELCVAWLFG